MAITWPHDSKADHHHGFRFWAMFHGYWCCQAFPPGLFLLLVGVWEDEVGDGCSVAGDKWLIFVPLPWKRGNALKTLL